MLDGNFLFLVLVMLLALLGDQFCRRSVCVAPRLTLRRLLRCLHRPPQAAGRWSGCLCVGYLRPLD